MFDHNFFAITIIYFIVQLKLAFGSGELKMNSLERFLQS